MLYIAGIGLENVVESPWKILEFLLSQIVATLLNEIVSERVNS